MVAPGIMPVLSSVVTPPLTNLWIWWDISNPASVSGFNDGDRLTQVNDLSGNGHDSSTVNSNQSSKYRNASVTINGLPVAEFTASESSGANRITNNTSTAGFTAATLYFVGRLNNDPPAAGNTGLWFANDGFDFGFAFPFTDGIIYDPTFSTVRKTTVNPSASLASPFYYGVLSTNGSWENRLNGSSLFSTGTNTFRGNAGGSPLSGTAGLYLGNSSITGYNGAFDGVIGEVLMYSSVLSGADLTQLEKYLGNKWGV